MFRVKDPTSWNSNAANTCNAVMEIINLKWMAFAVSWSSLLFMLMLMLVLLLMLKVEMMGKMNEFYGFHKLFCHTVNINEIKNRLSAKALVQCSADSCIWQLSLLALLQLTWLDKHDASLFQLLWHEPRIDQAQILHLTFSSLDTWHLAASSPPSILPVIINNSRWKDDHVLNLSTGLLISMRCYATLRSTGWEFQCLVVQLVIPSTCFDGFSVYIQLV